MANLGKLVTSFLNVNNEATVALANLNFDFAILKYEAPKEFSMVGTSLSSLRRNEAEDGKTHRIACRLGALFGAIVPATPNLINAYGLRASQIASSPKANPKRNPRYGPFADFVGIDGTSLWAAATSAQSSAGPHAPLAMYLLACMLARRWDPGVAISIWVEIVEQRQKEIEASLQDQPQHISLFMAAKHEITRDDLACWDASARAWLQSADEVKSVPRTKFDLIAKNISIDIGRNGQTYHSVIEVWKCAMQGMELLVQGVPQELSDGAMLLALSAWHLYPDLIVLGKTTKKVCFQDPLICSGGVITVGLQYADDEREPGMHWSLTLSQLSYYDEGTKVHARTDTSRVSMKELLVIAFGSFMSSWNIPYQSETAAAEFLVELRGQITDKGLYDPEWLRIFGIASQEFLSLKHADETLCTELMAWGRRRGKNWLLKGKSLPFFGLLKSSMLAALTLTDGHEAAFYYFRELANTLDPKDKTFLVRYREQRRDTIYFEFATVTPHVRRSSKRGLDGSLKSEEYHQRWLYLAADPDVQKIRCYCIQCSSGCPCRELRNSLCTDACHIIGPHECQGLKEIDKSREASLKLLGEESRWISHRDMYASRDLEVFHWRNAPAMLRSPSSEALVTCPSVRNGFERCCCAEPIALHLFTAVDELVFEKVEGNPATYCLFAAPRHTSLNSDATAGQKKSRAVPDRARVSDLQSATSTLRGGFVNKDLLQRYIRAYEWSLEDFSLTEPNAHSFESRRTKEALLVLINQEHLVSIVYRTSLKALSFAQRIYEHLPGAFIPLSIIGESLSSVSWLDQEEKAMTRIYTSPVPVDQDLIQDLTARCFACIIFFESGTLNVHIKDCKPVIAIASGNSIFVASYLMSDPGSDATSNGLVQRVTGNVGMAGMSLLVPPQRPPHVRPLANDFRIVSHIEFDGEEEDNFSSTSLHLRFTKWRRPLNAPSRGNIDEGLFYVESVVSAHDSGKWVCDLDVQLASKAAKGRLLEPVCVCEGKGDAAMVSIDTWEELLDPPDALGIVRAKGNWPARLAALALRCQTGFGNQTLVIPVGAKICAGCLAAEYLHEMGSDSGVIID